MLLGCFLHCGVNFSDKFCQGLCYVRIVYSITEYPGMRRIASLAQRCEIQQNIAIIEHSLNRSAYIQDCEPPVAIDSKAFAFKGVSHCGYLKLPVRRMEILQPVGRQKPFTCSHSEHVISDRFVDNFARPAVSSYVVFGEQIILSR